MATVRQCSIQAIIMSEEQHAFRVAVRVTAQKERSFFAHVHACLVSRSQ
jgi:hypothetical protein